MAHEWQRLLLASLVPFIAAALQWALGPILPPLTWIFLYPAIFFGAWIGGFWGGFISTVLGTLLGVYIFIAPEYSWEISDSRHKYSVLVFFGMGLLFSFLHEYYQRSQKKLKQLSALVAQNDQSRLKLALESSHAGLWEWDLLTNTNEWSDNLWDLYGLEPHSCKPSNEAWQNTLHPDDKEAVVALVNNAVKAGSAILAEWRVKNTDRWLLAKGKPELNGDGIPYLYRGIVVDITDRKKMEKEVKERKQFLEFALITLNAGAWELDLGSRKLYRTLLHDQIFGYSTLLPKWSYEIFLDHVIPEDKEAVGRHFLDALAKKSDWDLECRIRRTDGEIRWIHVKGSYKRDSSGNTVRIVGIIQDITENKLMATELQRWADAFHHCAHGIAIGDPITNLFRFCNQAFAVMEGYDNPEEIVGLPILQLYAPDTHEQIKRHINEADYLGKTQFETVHKRKDGVEIQVQVDLVSVKNNNNQILYRVATVQDITERKKIESEKNQADMRYRALVEQAAPDAIYVHDHDGNFIEVNQKAAEYDGYTKAELLTMNVFDVEVGLDLPSAQAEWSCAQPGETYTLNGHHRRKDGSKFPVEIRFGLMEDNGRRLYIAIVRDISERKAAEAKLLLQSKALDAAANAIMITDNNAVIQWVNPAFTRLTGYGPEECIGVLTDNLFKCSVLQPDVFEDVWKTINAGEIWHGEIVYPRKDGSLYTEEQTITPVIDGQGKILNFIAIKQDITTRKQKDAELEQYKNHLEQLVEERTRELDLAREEAVRLSQVKTAFLANMSHEIRSPMNAMMGFFYLLEQRPLDAEARELVRKVHYAGHSLLGIINDILDFSKIESGHLQIEHVTFCLSDVLDQVAALMSAAVGDKNLELIIKPCPLFAHNLIGDGLRLQQVLVNLTSNAIKFTEKGEVELSINVVETRETDWIKLRFAVRDTGIGISQEKITEIFNAFTQADTTISRRFGGTGLGLAISRQLVTLMGGTLQVESEPGEGSKFWFELVLQRDQAYQQRWIELKDLKLLVADDSETTRHALLGMVNGLGWAADAVESGEEAYSQTLLQSEGVEPYDIVLLDWKMPGLDGLETAKAIKLSIKPTSNHRNESPIIIMVSAFSRDELLAHADIGYVDLLLSKPVTPSLLYDAVMSVINKHEPGYSRIKQMSGGDFKTRLSGVRVLVVDDSDINLEIAQNILKLHDAEVNLAKSGRAAIDWLLANPGSTDILLMDVQMPDMDGYETTRAIRQNPLLSGLPVIALTAGAFTDDQETAQAAGMDDFVAKPFNVEQLVSVIQRLTGIQSGNGFKDQSNALETFASLELKPNVSGDIGQPLPTIDFAEGLKLFGNEIAFHTYLGKFESNYANAGNEIFGLIQRGDTDGASALAHKLKGAAANLALKNVAKNAGQVEDQLRTGTVIVKEEYFLQDSINQACHAISGLNSQENIQVDANGLNIWYETGEFQELKILLEKLLIALDKDNPSAAESALVPLRVKLPSEYFASIQEQITDFDFQSAKDLTRKLIRKLTLN